MTDWTPPGPGPWQQDSAHIPDPMTTGAAEVFPPGFRRGMAEGFARYGLLLDRIDIGLVNGYSYLQPQPFDRPGPDGPPSEDFIHGEIERRTGVAAEAVANKIWRDDMERWDAEIKPAAIRRHRELGDVDLTSLDNAELIDHVRAAAEHVEQMVYQHHSFNVSALFPVGDFALHTSRWTGRPPDSLLGVFDGHSSISAVLSDEIRGAVDALRADETAVALATGSGDASERLAEIRRLVPDVDEYVRSVDFRLTEGFDLIGPTVRERPELTLGKLSAALAADPGQALRRADEFAATLRSEVPEEHRAEFDEILGEARLVYRLRDERGVYSDISAIGLLRLAMLEAGRRVHAAGRLHEAEHVLDSRTEEAIALLEGGGPDADELAARVGAREDLAAADAPRFLGPPPPEPPPVDQLPPPLARVMGSIGFTIVEGILGQLEQPEGDEATVVGIAAAGGLREGPARLVRRSGDGVPGRRRNGQRHESHQHGRPAPRRW